MLRPKPLPTVPTAFIALGSNLGERRQHLRQAAARLAALPGNRIRGASALYETAAVGIAAAPDFLNAVLRLEVTCEPETLLDECLALEAEAGRVRGPGSDWSSRTLDLDLLCYDDRLITSARLILPHPRIVERAFVLAPLAEVAPDWLIGGRTVADWAAACPSEGVRRMPRSEEWFLS